MTIGNVAATVGLVVLFSVQLVLLSVQLDDVLAAVGERRADAVSVETSPPSKPDQKYPLTGLHLDGKDLHEYQNMQQGLAYLGFESNDAVDVTRLRTLGKLIPALRYDLLRRKGGPQVWCNTFVASKIAEDPAWKDCVVELERE